ncbi:substrate-binding domain-containing protein [Oscillospiraceae bacterium PP1C4]
MTRKNIFVFILLLAAFVVSFLILTFDVFGEDHSPQVYNISIIVRGKNSDSWANIKQGADQAASEMNVDLSFITLTEENNLREQISLLEREYISDVDAIVISAADSEGLVKPIERIADKLPIICIESAVGSTMIGSYISADNYAMGVQLGQEILSSGNARKRLAVIDSSLGCTNVQQRMDGLMSVLRPIGGEIEHWAVPDDSAKSAAALAAHLDKKSTDVVVALDLSSLELVGQAVSDVQASYLDLFGIGASGKVASFIEQDIVSATIVQNDFGIGYLGVKSAVDALQNKAVSKTANVEHRLINWNNMYDSENQRLLFPFIR